MKKIKVLHVTSTRYGIGGVERLLLDMSDKYDADRFDVAYSNLFCDADGSGAFPSEVRRRGLPYIEINGRRAVQIPKMVMDLRRAIIRERVDVLHLHMLQATIVGGAAVRGLKDVRTVLTRHYTDDLSKHARPVKAADLYFTKRMDRIAAISRYVGEDLVRLGVDPGIITHVSNGTDLRLFDERVLQPPPVPLAADEGDPLLITVGSLTPRKGHRFLIEAMPAILKAYPKARLLIVGEGPEKEGLNRLRSSLGLDGRVSIIGFVENVAPLHAAADVYVHPSIHEPFGIAILEAMAARKCVVATDVEGVPEIVLDGETGLLVPPANADVLARAVGQALGDPEAARRMGQNGRQRVEENFEIRGTVEKYQEMYLSVLKA